MGDKSGASGWRPIGNAPKDGTFVLVYLPETPYASGCQGCNVVSARYVGRTHDYNGWWESDLVEVTAGYYDGWDVENLRLSPSHWMPLPAPPPDAPRSVSK
jgi:hypothetical protein